MYLQIECSLYFQQKKLRETMDRLGVKVMAYGPLGSPGKNNTFQFILSRM